MPFSSNVGSTAVGIESLRLYFGMCPIIQDANQTRSLFFETIDAGSVQAVLIDLTDTTIENFIAITNLLT